MRSPTSDGGGERDAEVEAGLVRAAKEPGRREERGEGERGQVVGRKRGEGERDQFKPELFIFIPECSRLPWLRCWL